MITILTASLPDRGEMLARSVRSVRAQTVQPDAHLIRIQSPDGMPAPAHIARQHNLLLACVDTPWVATLDDDDTYLPHHFETVLPHLVDADVVYTYAREGAVARVDVTDWTGKQLEERLLEGNRISSNAAIRTDTLRSVRGWDEFRGSTGVAWDDWDLWIRLARIGARFRCVPVETWDYHHHDRQSSR